MTHFTKCENEPNFEGQMLAFSAKSKLSNTTSMIAPGPLRRSAAGTEIDPQREPREAGENTKSRKQSQGVIENKGFHILQRAKMNPMVSAKCTDGIQSFPASYNSRVARGGQSPTPRPAGWNRQESGDTTSSVKGKSPRTAPCGSRISTTRFFFKSWTTSWPPRRRGMTAIILAGGGPSFRAYI